jgi:hypothetical protein
MVVTLIAVALLAVAFAYFVIQPLLASQEDSLTSDARESETEFRDLILLRDALIQRLIGQPLTGGESAAGRATADAPTANAATQRVAALDEQQATLALARTCLVLKRLGLPYLPVLILAILGGALLAAPHSALAQAESAQAQPPKDSPDSDPMSRMPELQTMPDGTNLAQIHQFVLSPDQGQMRVYYLAMFRNNSAPTTVKLRIPSPDGAKDFDFSSMTEATLDPGRALEPPVLSAPAQSGINQIQGMFSVPAFSGTLNWNSSFFKTLPGVVLIILPQYHDVLSTVFGDAFNTIGMWPPRFAPFDSGAQQGFELKLSVEQPNDRDPNYARLKNPPQQYSYHLFRRGESDAPYPQFAVRGVAPSRLPASILIATFGIMLAAVAIARAFIHKKPAPSA